MLLHGKCITLNLRKCWSPLLLSIIYCNVLYIRGWILDYTVLWTWQCSTVLLVSDSWNFRGEQSHVNHHAELKK
jgi:hypothetical protein